MYSGLCCVVIDSEILESGNTKSTTAEAWSAFIWHHSSLFHCQWKHNQDFPLLLHILIEIHKAYQCMWWNMFLPSLGINSAVYIKWVDVIWCNNLLLLVPNYDVLDMVVTSGCYGCVFGMSYTEINKAVLQWLLTFNLCKCVTWLLTYAFHRPLTHAFHIP